MHQGVPEINTVSNEIASNSKPRKFEGQFEYRANKLAVPSVVEAKIEKPADNCYIAFLE
jgi:hypothetical protein